MQHASISDHDFDLLHEILVLAEPDRHAPDEGLAFLTRLEETLGSESLLVRSRDGVHLRPRAAEPPDHSPCELAVQAPGPDGRIVAELLFRRTEHRPFGERELVLLDLLQPLLAGWLAAEVMTGDPGGREPLTARQIEILHLVQFGMSNQEIARSLGISAATVRKHLENAYQRLGVLSRTAAVSAAFGRPTD